MEITKEEESIDPSQLPQVRNWDGSDLYLYRGFWFGPITLSSMIPFQKHFQAIETDVVLATYPKSGTTWLMALTFSIIHRVHYKDNVSPHPMLSSNPHDLVPFFEDLYRNNNTSPPAPLDHQHGRRIFATHLPYSLLAPSITRDPARVLAPSITRDPARARIVYICRNPLDQFISYYHFNQKIRHLDDDRFGEAFDLFCRGVQRHGPHWDNVLEYWKVSRERPGMVLFLKYEDLKKDTEGCTKKLAEFLGCPFSEEEEGRGVIGEIVRLCGFEALKGLEVNKTGKRPASGFENRHYFRKGEVGDWGTHLSPAMAERVQKIVEEKLRGSGLSFDYSKF